MAVVFRSDEGLGAGGEKGTGEKQLSCLRFLSAGFSACSTCRAHQRRAAGPLYEKNSQVNCVEGYPALGSKS